MTELGRQHAVELRVPSCPAYEEIVCAAAVAVARRAGMGRDRTAALRTAVGEAYRNAVEHGNRGDDALPVTVTLMLQPAALVVEISDRGPGFESPPAPDIEAQVSGRERRGGWGLPLMRGLVDQVSFHVTAQGEHLTRLLLSTRDREKSAQEDGD